MKRKQWRTILWEEEEAHVYGKKRKHMSTHRRIRREEEEIETEACRRQMESRRGLAEGGRLGCGRTEGYKGRRREGKEIKLRLAGGRWWGICSCVHDDLSSNTLEKD